VLLDGHVVPSCLVLAAEADQGCLTTVEYFSRDGQPSFVQEELVQAGAVQCGFCTPGIVVSAHALLAANPQPSGDEVRTALAGNLCRCTGYAKIVQAVLTAAARSER
jgi:carbon-monoxide dehydrogenase small subunit